MQATADQPSHLFYAALDDCYSVHDVALYYKKGVASQVSACQYMLIFQGLSRCTARIAAY